MSKNDMDVQGLEQYTLRTEHEKQWPAGRSKIEGVKKRTEEPQNIEYRMTKGGIATRYLLKI